MMNFYSLTFVTQPIESDELINELMEDLDASVTLQASLTTVDMLVEGVTGLSAAKTGFQELEDRGVEVLRLMPDLVNMATVAARVGVSRQAASAWLKTDSPRLPEPYALAGSGPVWDWADMSEWLSRAGKSTAQDWETATVHDVHRFTNWLQRVRMNGWGEPALTRAHSKLTRTRFKDMPVVIQSDWTAPILQLRVPA